MRRALWLGLVLIAPIVGGCSDEAPPLQPPLDPTGSGGSGGGGGSGPSQGILSVNAASVVETDPQIAVSSSGAVALVWTGRASDDTTHVGYVLSDDGGNSWSDPQIIESAEGDSYLAPDVVSDNAGNFFLSFLRFDRTGGTSSILLATSSGADGFGTLEPVTDDATPGFYGRPRITITNGGRLLVAYTQLIAQISELWVGTRSLSGDTFQHQQLSQGGGHWSMPHACSAYATVSGRAFVAALVQGRVFLFRTTDDGDTWGVVEAEAGEDVGDVTRAPSCEAIGNRVWVSYGLQVQNGGLRSIRVATSDDGGETMTGWGTVSDPEIGPKYAVHQIAIEPPDTGHLLYYAGAGIGDENGSLRRVEFEVEDLPAPPTEPPPDPPPEEEPEGLPSKVVKEPVTFQLIDTNTRWLGDSVGVSFDGSELYIGYVDNASLEAHVAFAKVSP